MKNKVHVTKKSKAVLVNAVEKAGKDKWEMCRDDIVLQEKKLGSGHFGDVMKGILRPSNTPVAVKSCKGNVSQTVKQKFLSEAEILKQYDHPNIVRLIGVCADREPVFIGKSGSNLNTILIVFCCSSSNLIVFPTFIIGSQARFSV